MSDAATDEEIEEPKSSKLPLILGVLLAILGAGGGYFVVSSGMLFGGESAVEPKQEEVTEAPKEFAFLPLDPLTISLQEQGTDRYLRFSAELEVKKAHLSSVEEVKPRIIDILNGYLRAIEFQDLRNPASLPRLRAQMLRRVQVVAGADKVNDLLIMEFVIN